MSPDAEIQLLEAKNQGLIKRIKQQDAWIKEARELLDKALPRYWNGLEMELVENVEWCQRRDALLAATDDGRFPDIKTLGAMADRAITGERVMRLSQKKRQAVYDAIANEIEMLRIDIQRHGSPRSEELDARLFNMQNMIWRKVHKALNLDGPT